MPIDSNIHEVGAWVTSVTEGFSFDSPGINESIGYDSAIAIAEGIQERSRQKEMGATEKWPENDPEYALWKANKYHSRHVNFRTGQMLSMISLTANITTADNGKTTVMNYGTGEYPSSSLTGYLDEDDLSSTDKEKATLAHFGGRPFFELDQEIDSERVLPIVNECLGKYLKDRNAS
jgi:hypothetical protein